VYVSFDDGDSWQPLSLDLPTTWMRDLLVHDDDLIVATQGRGIWVLDDVAPLRELAAGAALAPVHLFAPLAAVRLRASENRDTPWPPETPLGENPPTGAVLDYWLDRAAPDSVTLTITDRSGALVRRFSSADRPESLAARRYFEAAWLAAPRILSGSTGMHRFIWDLREPRPKSPEYGYTIAAVRTAGTPVRPEGPLVLPGAYTVTLSANGVTVSRPLTVRLDPRVHLSERDLREQLERTRTAILLLERCVGALRDIEHVRGARGADLSPALVDSLARLAGTDDPGLRGTARRLSGLVDDLQSADAAPTQGEKAALDDCARLVDGLTARWRKLQMTMAGNQAH
jgi:hypothetical protein